MNGTIVPNNSQVAALVDEHSRPQLWILASVLGYRPGPRPKYEVIDLDAGDESNPNPVRKKYILDIKKIIPLPTLDEYPMSKRKEFSKGTRVLAVFPVGGITVLYPADVVAGPKKVKTITINKQLKRRTQLER